MAPKTPVTPKTDKPKRVLTQEQLAKMHAARMDPASRLPALQAHRAKIVAEYEGRLAKIDAKIARCTSAPDKAAVKEILESGLTAEQIKAKRNELNAALRALSTSTPDEAEAVAGVTDNEGSAE